VIRCGKREGLVNSGAVTARRCRQKAREIDLTERATGKESER
jgi:hypothetical protein